MSGPSLLMMGELYRQKMQKGARAGDLPAGDRSMSDGDAFIQHPDRVQEE
jgi:hypothetical protein